MFHHESRKPIYFGISRSKFKVTRHKNIAGVGYDAFECWLLSASVV